jgi:hypothetical protein
VILSDWSEDKTAMGYIDARRMRSHAHVTLDSRNATQ